jgi:hypothetical protein
MEPKKKTTLKSLFGKKTRAPATVPAEIPPEPVEKAAAPQKETPAEPKAAPVAEKPAAPEGGLRTRAVMAFEESKVTSSNEQQQLQKSVQEQLATRLRKELKHVLGIVANPESNLFEQDGLVFLMRSDSLMVMAKCAECKKDQRAQKTQITSLAELGQFVSLVDEIHAKHRNGGVA